MVQRTEEKDKAAAITQSHINSQTVKIWSQKAMKTAMENTRMAKFLMSDVPKCPICCREAEPDSTVIPGCPHKVKDLIDWFVTEITILEEQFQEQHMKAVLYETLTRDLESYNTDLINSLAAAEEKISRLEGG